MKIKNPVHTSEMMTLDRDCPGKSIGSDRESENIGTNQNAEKKTPTPNPQTTALVRFESGVVCEVAKQLFFFAVDV
jgi:hypothetical protein